MTDRAAIDAMDTALLAQGASVLTALSGTANVVMQLSRPGIGRAVKDSVAPGNLFADGAAQGDTGEG